MTAEPALQVEKAVYGGDGLARTPDGTVVFVPFALPGERVQVSEGLSPSLRILEASPQRVQPRCVHFGVCGGCQYQMASEAAQLTMKSSILQETLERAGLASLPEARVWASPHVWEYRNRIRLRVRTVDGALRLGYSRRGTNEFLPVTMCPIAAPVLWDAAQALLRAADVDRSAAAWLRATAEVEILCGPDQRDLQIHLLCPGKIPLAQGSLDPLGQFLTKEGVPLRSMGASRLHVPSGRAMEVLASWGADGLTYAVSEERFWLKRGSFFQVNRFLLPQMVALVCADRRGSLAWDLYAGVGLFARGLAKRFAAVTAVEANPVALAELQRGLQRSGDTAVQDTTLAFLRRAVVQRDRPELVVLDPPRAGAGEEACERIAQLRPAEIVYVSCDPTTLARDAAVLLRRGYSVAELHMIDLFPQTYHLETVMVLRHSGMAG